MMNTEQTSENILMLISRPTTNRTKNISNLIDGMEHNVGRIVFSTSIIVFYCRENEATSGRRIIICE